jgi:methylmalonyl-CoA mutase N-terminal domain/subunit
MSVDNGHRTVVGVNEFRTEEEEQPEILRVREEVVRRQVERLNGVRAERDQAKADALLKQLDEAARSDTNLMPVFIECVENYVTIGEICDVLRGVFGEQREYHVF